VGKKLTYLAIELRKKGRDARSAYAQVCQACEAVSNCDFTGERYEALRHTVGGAIPRWDDNIEKHDKESSKAISTVVTRVQSLLTERLREWTAYTAPTGWKRQTRWERREWMRLIFYILKTQHAEGLPEASHHNPEPEDDTDLIEDATSLKEWIQESREIVPRVLHAMKCLEIYVKRISKPRRRAAAEVIALNARRKKAKWRICAYLVRLYKQDKQTAILADRAIHRAGLVLD